MKGRPLSATWLSTFHRPAFGCIGLEFMRAIFMTTDSRSDSIRVTHVTPRGDLRGEFLEAEECHDLTPDDRFEDSDNLEARYDRLPLALDIHPAKAALIVHGMLSLRDVEIH